MVATEGRGRIGVRKLDRAEVDLDVDGVVVVEGETPVEVSQHAALRLCDMPGRSEHAPAVPPCTKRRHHPKQCTAW